MSGSAFHNAAEKIITKAKQIAAHNLKVDVNDVKFEEGIFSSAKTNQTVTIKDVAQNAVNPAKLPKDMEVGLFATAVYKADVENFPNGVHVCEVEVDPETGKTEVVKYSVVDDVGNGAPPAMQSTAPRAYTSAAGEAPSPRARSGARNGAVFTRFCINRFSPRRSARRLAMTSGMSHSTARPSAVIRIESQLISPCTTPCACTVESASASCCAARSRFSVESSSTRAASV